MRDDAYHFWRKNVRPGTTFGEFSRAPTLWQRFYDWTFSRTKHQPREVYGFGAGLRTSRNRSAILARVAILAAVCGVLAGALCGS